MRRYDMFSARACASRGGGTSARRTIRLSAIVAGGDMPPIPCVRAAQISMIRAAAAPLGGMHPYAPEATEDVPFSIFSAGTSGFTVTRVQVDRALALARYWSSPGSFTGGGALPALP